MECDYLGNWNYDDRQQRCGKEAVWNVTMGNDTWSLCEEHKPKVRKILKIAGSSDSAPTGTK